MPFPTSILTGGGGKDNALARVVASPYDQPEGDLRFGEIGSGMTTLLREILLPALVAGLFSAVGTAPLCLIVLLATHRREAARRASLRSGAWRLCGLIWLTLTLIVWIALALRVRFGSS